MKSVLLLLGTVGFSYMLNKILLRFSKNFGVESRQAQGVIRWGSTTKPTTGGISFYITFLVGSLVLFLVEPNLGIERDVFLALFVSGTLAFMIGFADDAYGTHPGLKFAGQALCGVVLLAFGIHIDFFAAIDPGLYWLDYVLTVFWVVGLMNSLNMLDNMDGVTTTIATTILVGTMMMIISTEGLSIMYYALITVVGGFIGFLFWNWRPAKVYMGDSGSLFVGMVLALVGIQYFWNIKAAPDNISLLRMGLIPLMVFLVPIMDTTFVTVARLARGQSPFVGGKDHLTHNLARVGIPEQWVPITLGIVSVVSSFLAYFAFRLIPDWRSIYAVFFAAYPIVLFGLF
ncbi:MAG: MraY family glycosyltransferase, partial [Bacteroidota bacterium]